jgi:hypothetical protein
MPIIRAKSILSGFLVIVLDKNWAR